MAIGTVKWFSEDKGIGIVSQDDGNEYVFLYQTDENSTSKATIAIGQKVSFNLAQGIRGMVASNIRSLNQ